MRAFQFVPYYFLLGCIFFINGQKDGSGWAGGGGNLSLLPALINTTKGAQKKGLNW